ncbi:MAG: hypothetical protein V4672_17470 [Verrucomicrobiota bacterium]
MMLFTTDAVAMKIIPSFLMFFGWFALVLWFFLTIVRSLLWLGFAFSPACEHPTLVVLSLVVYALPLLLFIWLNKLSNRDTHSLVNLTLGLACLLTSEALVAKAVGPNSLEVIIWQSLVLIVMLGLPIRKKRARP